MKNFHFRNSAIVLSLFLISISFLVAQNVTIQCSANSNKSVAVLDGSTQNSAAVLIWDDECQLDVLWKIVPATNGRVKIQNVNSGKFLAVDGGRTTNGTPIVLYQDNRQEDILWLQEPAGTNTRLKNINSGKYLAVEGGRFENGARLVLWDNNNQHDINWQIINIMPPINLAIILTPCSRQLVAGVINGSTDNNAEVILWSFENQADVIWIIEASGTSGYFTVKNSKSGKYLGIAGGSTQAGAKAVITPNFGQPDILWKIIRVSKYAFKLQNKKSNLFLGVEGGKVGQAGTNLVQWRDEKQVDIRWVFDSYLN